MLEGYVDQNAVLIAESGQWPVAGGQSEHAALPTTDHRPPTTSLGYVISRDRYLKRDELGIIYQLNVAPEARRMLVGAALVREVFARSAWGCRLYCLWCAQDLEANRFWEAMGFVPIAFRAGGRRVRRKDEGGRMNRGASLDSSFIPQPSSLPSARVHIFWQRRIDEGDAKTPYWYPYQTNQGAIREDRLVWPIPPGVRWDEVKAVELPGTNVARASRPCLPGSGKNDTGETPVLRKRKNVGETPALRGPGPGMVGILVGGRIKYVPRPGYVGAPCSAVAPVVPPVLKEPKARRAKAPRAKLDPALLTKVRELRDRWLEYVGANGVPSDRLVEGKYQVGRAVALPAAAVDRKALPDAA
jgi:ribosomal protein S18 acetylase RimI-like enzyme